VKDHRPVDDLSTEELERILLIKRREARLARLRQMKRSEQVVGRDPLETGPSRSTARLSPRPEARPEGSPKSEAHERLPTQPPAPMAHRATHLPWQAVPGEAHERRQFQGMGASASCHSVAVDDEHQRSLVAQLSGKAVRWFLAPLYINWRYVFNRILLLIEVAAVVGLMVITIGAWQDHERIKEETVEILVSPTPTPPTMGTQAPLINAVVLPGSHTPPDARGFSQPEPIPEHLRVLMQAITPQPVPTAGPEHATRIVIPSIGVNHPVVEGDGWEALKLGVGHTPWSVNPGETGNCILSAYNDIFGEIFRQLPEMELGDEIFVHTSTQIYRYVVKATRIIEPTQVEVMYPTNHPVLTLISSYPYLVDDKRVVVIAELEP
jgi:sortase A